MSTCWRTGALRPIETAFSSLLSFHFIVPNIVIVPNVPNSSEMAFDPSVFAPALLKIKKPVVNVTGRTTAIIQSASVNRLERSINRANFLTAWPVVTPSFTSQCSLSTQCLRKYCRKFEPAFSSTLIAPGKIENLLFFDPGDYRKVFNYVFSLLF